MVPHVGYALDAIRAVGTRYVISSVQSDVAVLVCDGEYAWKSACTVYGSGSSPSRTASDHRLAIRPRRIGCMRLSRVERGSKERRENMTERFSESFTSRFFPQHRPIDLNRFLEIV